MKTKIFTLLLSVCLSVVTFSTIQAQNLHLKNIVEIYDVPATQLTMNIQVWIPGNPATIANAGNYQVVPNPPYGASDYITGYSAPYEIYSVRIYDNSGGQNDATVGGFQLNDDFNYDPWGAPYLLNADYVPSDQMVVIY